MGKQKLWIGVLLGAMTGGLAALFDKETRYYTKKQLQQAKSVTSYVVQNPADVVRMAKDTSNQLNEKLNTNADNAINALEQAEETWNKVRKKDDPKKLDSTM